MKCRPCHLALLPLSALLVSCSSTPQWEQHFGESVRVAMAQQVIDPAAVRNTNPVTGLDGRAARAALDRYERSFHEPAQQSGALALGVSAGK